MDNVLITCEGKGKLHFWNYLINDYKSIKLFGKNPRALANEIFDKANGMKISSNNEIFITTEAG